MVWDPLKQQFIELDDHDQRDYDPEDEGAARGLVLGCLLGLILWLGMFAVWHWPWLRGPAASIGFVLALILAVWAAHTYIVEPYRARHPENPVVDWLRRSGL